MPDIINTDDEETFTGNVKEIEGDDEAEEDDSEDEDVDGEELEKEEDPDS